MQRIILTQQWVERIYDFCLPWPLVAIHVSYRITRIHLQGQGISLRSETRCSNVKTGQRYQAYIRKGHQPRPSNWKIDKCIEYLMSNPIPTSEKRDLDFLHLNWKNGKASNAW